MNCNTIYKSDIENWKIKSEEKINIHIHTYLEEPEIKLPTSAGSWKKQESSRKTSISALLTMPKPLTCGSQSTVENSERDGNTTPPDLPVEKPVCRPGSNS